MDLHGLGLRKNEYRSLIRTCDRYYWEKKRDEIRNVELQRITGSCTMKSYIIRFIMRSTGYVCRMDTDLYELFFELIVRRETAKEELNHLFLRKIEVKPGQSGVLQAHR